MTTLTDAARRVADRMANWPNHSENIQIMRQLVYQDPDILAALRDEVAASASPPDGLTDALTVAVQRCSNLMETCGSLHTWPALVASADDVLAAVEYVESSPDPKRTQHAHQSSSTSHARRTDR